MKPQSRSRQKESTTTSMATATASTNTTTKEPGNELPLNLNGHTLVQLKEDDAVNVDQLDILDTFASTRLWRRCQCVECTMMHCITPRHAHSLYVQCHANSMTKPRP